MKNKKRFIVFLIIIISGIFGLKLYKDIKHPFTIKTGQVPVFIKKGDSLSNVIKDLKKNKLIKNEYAMKMYIKNNKLDTNIKSGKYYIDSNLSIKEFVRLLNKGSEDKNYIKITIPEGYSIEDIAKLLERKGLIKRDEFLKSCKNYKVPDYITSNTKVKYKLEGYLFPDTYKFKNGSSGEDIISSMLKQFETVLREIEKENNKKIQDVSKIITMASLIEKESRIDEDRKKIASVILNRLNKNMKLQIDATILYAFGEHKDRLYSKDLKIQSPYNTYKFKGLPPGPICNPGIECIDAALNPIKTQYLYYVLEDNKKHYFTDNYKKFLQAKKRYKNFINK